MTDTLAQPLTFPSVLHSEWIKFRSLRSPVWALSSLAVVVLGFGLLMSVAFSAVVAEGAGPQLAAELGFASLDDVDLGATVSTMSVQLVQLIVAALAVLMISGEYSTGMIKSTFVAVPTRLPVLWAKAVVIGAATFVVGALAALVTFAVTHPLLAASGLASELSEPRVLRALIGAGLYLAAVAVLSLAIGTMLRSAAGGISAAIGLLMLLPGVLSMIPVDAVQVALPYLPAAAGQRILAVAEVGILTPWQGMGVMTLWVALALACSAILLKKRDA